MRVLVVEDQKKIAGFIRQGLEEQGMGVEVSHDGTEGFLLATTESWDPVILDIMLPGRDGLSILRGLRERRNPVPVMLLTARNELNERVEGLNLGADDYLTKPFYVEELVARVHALIRRGAGNPQVVLSFMDLSLNCVTHQVTRGGEAVELTITGFTGTLAEGYQLTYRLAGRDHRIEYTVGPDVLNLVRIGPDGRKTTEIHQRRADDGRRPPRRR